MDGLGLGFRVAYSQNRGTQYMPQNTQIRIIGDSQNGTPTFGTPPFDTRAVARCNVRGTDPP